MPKVGELTDDMKRSLASGLIQSGQAAKLTPQDLAVFTQIANGRGPLLPNEQAQFGTSVQSAVQTGAIVEKGMPGWMKVAIIGTLAAMGGAALIPLIAGGGAAAGAGAGTAAIGPGLPAVVGTGSAAVGTGTGLATTGSLLSMGGKAIGAATTAAGNNRLNQQVLNTQGQSAFESELMNRAKLEQDQRSSALRDVYRNSYAQNPGQSPYDTKGPAPYSPEYLATLAAQSAQGQQVLKTPAQYATGALPPLAPTTTAKDKKSMLEQIGTWAGPAMTIASLY